MNITPTAGIAAAWSAAKSSPNQAMPLANSRAAEAGRSTQEAPEPKKSPPAPEGQGTRVDVQV